MNVKPFVHVVSLLLCAAAFGAEPAKRPNVLFIICDDLNTTAIGAYGNTVCKTPNIDRLAARGTRFEHAYSQWPLCWPSRHSMLSGRRPDARFSSAANFRDRVPDVTFFPQYFRQNGYFTARVGKIFHARTVMNGMTSYEDPACWDVSELGGTETDPCGYAVLFADHPKGLAAHPDVAKVVDHHELLNKAGGPGYDYWMDMSAVNLPDEQCTDGAIAARVAQLMQERASAPDGKPFLLAAGFRRPHQLWMAPKKYFDLYPWQSIELPQQPADDLADISKAALTRGAPGMTDEQRKKAIAAYYACVTMVDAQVGKLLDEMDRLKLWENTVVVFTSDHGWHLNEHGLWGKVTLFEESAKVPLIIAGSGTARGATSKRVCELLDLYPTLCAVAGLQAPDKLDGINITPQLSDAASPRSKPAFSVLRRGKIWGRAVYTERYRYTEWGDAGNAGVEFYDHQTDPKEFTNLANDVSQRATIDQLKTALAAEIKLRDDDAAGEGVKD